MSQDERSNFIRERLEKAGKSLFSFSSGAVVSESYIRDLIEVGPPRKLEEVYIPLCRTLGLSLDDMEAAFVQCGTKISA